MSTGIGRTVRILSRSHNRAASALLEQASHSSNDLVRKAAYTELISKGSPGTFLDYIRNFDTLDESIRDILRLQADKLVNPIRIGIFGSDPRLQKNAVRAAFFFKVYDLIPILLQIVTDPRGGTNRSHVPLEEFLLRLLRLFTDELETVQMPGPYHSFVLSEIRPILRKSILGFKRNDSSIVLKVYLYLYRYLDDPELGSSAILRNPLHPIYPTLSALLQSENDPHVFQFVLDSLEQPNVPGLILSTLSNRTDMSFLLYILAGLPDTLSETAQENLSKIHRWEWSKAARPLMAQLDEKQQKSLVDLIRFSDIPEETAFSILHLVIQFGKSQARRLAVAELASHTTTEAAQIVWDATEDSDPEVQAAALRQLRIRNYPEGTARLLQYADSPHPIVRDAVYAELPEFRMSRLLETFEHLRDEQRRAALQIVQKIDPKAKEILARELQYGTPRMKFLAIQCIELVPQFVVPLEELLSALLLRDELPEMRVKAAELLGMGQREMSRHSLMQAFHRDVDAQVRAAAQRSLDQRNLAKQNKTETKV